MLKALSFLKYLHFCSDFLVMQKNGLIRMLRLISKLMTSQTRQQIVTIYIFNIYIYIAQEVKVTKQ